MITQPPLPPCAGLRAVCSTWPVRVCGTAWNARGMPVKIFRRCCAPRDKPYPSVLGCGVRRAFAAFWLGRVTGVGTGAGERADVCHRGYLGRHRRATQVLPHARGRWGAPREWKGDPGVGGKGRRRGVDLRADPGGNYDVGEFDDSYSAMPQRRVSGGLGASAGTTAAGTAPELDSWGAK
jgi:hypothetical protein